MQKIRNTGTNIFLHILLIRLHLLILLHPPAIISPSHPPRKLSILTPDASSPPQSETAGDD